MERKIIWLIAASTVLIGILLWSSKDAAKPPPRFSPMVDIRAACETQKQFWCHLALPDDAGYPERTRCAEEYVPRCVGCLLETEYARKRERPHGAPRNGCRALQQWNKDHR
jgi:hypothetical protein